MRKNYLILIAILSFILSGCATFPETKEPIQKSNLSVGMAKKIIKKNKTNQAEILEWFGSPNIITKNRSNDEVWNYNRMSFDSKIGSDGSFLIFWGASRAMSTNTTKSFDLIIIFNKNDIVKNYSVIHTSY